MAVAYRIKERSASTAQAFPEVTMLAYLFLLFAVAVHLRFLPLPFSFAPVTAALLYFGARRPRKEMWIPVAALAASGVYLSRSVYGYAVLD